MSAAAPIALAAWFSRRRANRCWDWPPAADRPCTSLAPTLEPISRGGLPVNTPAANPPSRTRNTPTVRSAAGGQSQQRFARRRENQAASAIGAAADTAVKVLVPYAERLDAVVLGGDRRAVTAARADPRLRPVMRHAVNRFLTVPDPKLAVLRDTPRQFLAVRIHLTGPA